ncbi:MAG: porin [Bryobacteraceae bacterium]
MERMKCVCTALIGCLLAYAAVAQTPAPSQPAPGPAASAQTPAPAAPSAPQSLLGPVDLSGIIDAYYDLNFSHPASGNNQLRNFDMKANQFSLNMAKVTLSHDPDPIGFRLDFGFGRAFETIHSTEAAPGVFRNIEQAYVSVKPARAKGLEVDFGQFVTSAGAEVIETKENWNYSRSLLFAWAIPYYHFGLRATMPLGKYFTAGVHLVNGWNNVEDNNSGKTVGLTGALAVGKVTWTQTYHVGPEKTGTNRGLRHLYDTTLLVNATGTTSFHVNYDYGVDKKILGGENRWTGIAGAARFQLSRVFALAPRLEWFNDADGFATGTVQKVKEVTLTGEFKLREGVLTRLEYRRDWSNAPFFDRGSTPGTYKNQDTLLAGLVLYFSAKR